MLRIRIHGPFDDVTGYAETVRQIAMSLFDIGIEVSMEVFNWGTTRIDLSRDQLKKAEIIKQKNNKYDVILNISIPIFFNIVQNKPCLGITMLEVDGIPEKWSYICNKLDSIIVPSEFNRNTFCNSGVLLEKLKVVHLGVDSQFFVDDGACLFPCLNNYDFIFLSIGEWIPRKGFDFLIKAFLQEFTSADNVCLVIKSHSNGKDYDPCGLAIKFEIKKLIKQVKRKKGVKYQPPTITVIPYTLPAQNMPALYRQAHCFVLATRGEGWNMPAFEALASRVPVITTKWSAHLDHLDETNSYLIELEGLEQVPSYGLSTDEIYRGFKWAKPSMEHLQYLLRYVYENYEEAKGKAEAGANYVKNELSWNKCAQKIENICLNSKNVNKN